MRILLKLPTRLTLSKMGKELFSRNFRLSLAKRPEKPLVETRPLFQKPVPVGILITMFGVKRNIAITALNLK